MDRGDQMALSGSASYYMQRGIGACGGQQELLSIHPPSNPNIPFQPNIGGGAIGSTLPLKSSVISPHGVKVGAPSGAPPGEPVKRKRGRPRKYGPDGPSSSSNPGTMQSQKRGRGYPSGSGKKQQLASVGKSLLLLYFCFIF